MTDINKLKMEAADMEAVNGGYFSTPSPELEATKEAADSIGEQLRAIKEATDHIGVYYRPGRRTARGKC